MEHPWAGRGLGTRSVSYDEDDVILYALAVGARAEQLDLVFERDLRVLPTFAFVLGQWAPDVLGSSGVFDSRTAVHGSQRLETFQPLPRSGTIDLTAQVGRVWDKGKAAVFEVEVASEYFSARWSIFAPGEGGFGGNRGEARGQEELGAPRSPLQLQTHPEQAVIYRLLGDKHHIHVDPVAASKIGAPRPILHGLCTLAMAVLPLAEAAGAHPADLRELEGRFASPVLPGDALTIDRYEGERFDVRVGDRKVISDAVASFEATP